MENFIPKVIYHYCDLNAFLAILNYKKLWLSNSYNLNDSFENRWLSKNIEDVRGEFEEYKEEINQVIYHYNNNPEVPYVCCFSRQGDILSQWRAYANDGKGVAIGFNTDYFNHINITGNNSHSGYPIILTPVIYDNEQQKKLIRGIFENVIKDCKNQRENQAIANGHAALKRISALV